MNLATFVARDPYRPAATKEELDDLLFRMDGVEDWTVNTDGEVIVEYDRTRISDELMEDALAGIEFRLKHISDKTDAGQAEIHEALGH